MESPALIDPRIEGKLSHQIRVLYADHLEHQPEVVTCQLFNAKLAIVLGHAVTRPEQFLIDSGHKTLAQQVRHSLDEIFKPKLKMLIQNATRAKVSDLLMATQLDTGRTNIIAVLTEPPGPE